MNWFCILPKICSASFRRFTILPQHLEPKIFRHSKKDLHCKSFCVCLIKLDLKLQQRGRPLKELRGRHVESIQFFAL